jgi:adenylate cyclase class 2
MSIEVEIKFRVSDPAALAERARQQGATPLALATQMDTYFTHPARDFAVTDEVLRIRSGPEGNHLTFKGPRWSGPTKTREEIEVEFAASPEESHRMARLLDRLGFETLAVVGKERTTFRFKQNDHTINVAIDDAWTLGAFAEVETIAATEADVPAAQQAVLALAESLGLTEVEPRSYLRMVLERKAEAAPPPALDLENSPGSE